MLWYFNYVNSNCFFDSIVDVNDLYSNLLTSSQEYKEKQTAANEILRDKEKQLSSQIQANNKLKRELDELENRKYKSLSFYFVSYRSYNKTRQFLLIFNVFNLFI